MQRTNLTKTGVLITEMKQNRTQTNTMETETQIMIWPQAWGNTGLNIEEGESSTIALRGASGAEQFGCGEHRSLQYRTMAEPFVLTHINSNKSQRSINYFLIN